MATATNGGVELRELPDLRTKRGITFANSPFAEGLLRLAERGRLARNHPFAKRLAEDVYGIPYPTFLAVQKGKKLDQQQVKRFSTELEKSKPAEPEGKTIAEIRKNAGFRSQRDLLVAIGVSEKNMGFGVAIDKGTVPSNHPVIPRLAQALRSSESRIRALCKGAPLDDRSLRQLATRFQRSLVGTGHGRGSALVPASLMQQDGTVAKRPRATLKKETHELRSAARSVATTVNVAIMQGDPFVSLPADEIGTLLNDYFKRCGIDAPMILGVGYAERFG